MASKIYFLKNLDIYYFAVNSFVEFPDASEMNVRQLVYDEFGYRDNSFPVSRLVNRAKNHFSRKNRTDCEDK